MCLTTINSRPSIAKEDIVCYKLFIYNSVLKDFTTPFVNIIIPSIPYIMDDNDKEEEIFNILGSSLYEINSGYIHAYRQFPYYITVSSTSGILTKNVIVECIIPKGTKYYTGINNDICSKKLILLKVIEGNMLAESQENLLEDKRIKPFFILNQNKFSSFKSQVKDVLISLFKRFFINNNN